MLKFKKKFLKFIRFILLCFILFAYISKISFSKNNCINSLTEIPSLYSFFIFFFSERIFLVFSVKILYLILKKILVKRIRFNLLNLLLKLIFNKISYKFNFSFKLKLFKCLRCIPLYLDANKTYLFCVIVDSL